MAPETSTIHFKIASQDWEFEQIHQLNYLTFVEEIPQHPPCHERRLVDRFHADNLYCIAVRRRQLLGMVTLRGARPFSLERKLADLEAHLPQGRQLCEVRLLATVTGTRNGLVFRGLVDLLVEHALARGYDLAVISGTTRQAGLYRHLGFVPFGPLVGSGEALYQPMYLTLEALRARGRALPALDRAPLGRAPQPRGGEPANFLPGPVTLHADVQEALQRPAVSHRSVAFLADFQAARRQLCRLANACHVKC